VAVLVGVFAPLDAIMQAKALIVRSWLAILGFVIAVFATGVFLEVKWRWTR